MKKLTIGIIAHVDSGKTTLSEAILYSAGVVRSLGRVDHKNAYLDTDAIERDRGITIFTGQAPFTYNNISFTLLDTPGHVDFSPETERTLKVLDCAVLVISGSDGVQSHTETLCRLLEAYRIPTFIFINKMDISPYTRDELLYDLKKSLGESCIDFSRRLDDTSRESLAVCSEELMEAFLSGGEFSDALISSAVGERKLFPCAFGSALRAEGVDELLSLICRFSPEPRYKKDFAAKVFKLTGDDSGERITHVKLTGGRLRVRDQLTLTDRRGFESSEKITAIRIYSGSKFKTVNEVEAGCVCALTGLSTTYPGQGLGDESDSGAAHLEPVLSYKLVLPDGVDTHTALTKLRRLGEEEPELHIDYSEALGEIRFRIMGEVQLEVLRRVIDERFGMKVDFIDGGIAYRETIKAPIYGVGHYEPLRHYAEVQLKLEPTERGSGLTFVCELPENSLDLSWQRLIFTHLHEREFVGVLTGSPITDMKITLAAGRAHQKHTEGGDFRQATYRAVRQGLMKAESVLLEPWYDFRFELPSESVGRVMTDITRMGGELDAPDSDGSVAILTGRAPVSELRGYHRELPNFTKGRGKLSLTLGAWRECHNADEVIEAFGYDPERDLDNPADSVFCSHGVGVAVKWNEVDEHKHTEIEEPRETEIDESFDDFDPQARFERYMKAVTTDAELTAIFERTYGPIKKRVISEPKKVKAVPSPKPPKPRPAFTGKDYLLIDGYNIIFAWDDLRALSQKSLDLAREELIGRICNYRGFRQCEVILVFDAYKVKNNPGEIEQRSGITVVYTKEAETADTYIEKATHTLAKSHRVRVATSDGQEQLIILGNGATRLSASALRSEVDSVTSEIRSFLS